MEKANNDLLFLWYNCVRRILWEEYMKKLLLVLCVSFILCGCNTTSSEAEIEKLMAENEYIIVDVRTKEEYEESHIDGAINIPYDEINSNTNLDKDQIIFVYCKSGARSEVAFNNLTNLGYTVYDLGAFSKIDLPKE